MQIQLISCGGWYLPHTAKALHQRGALAGLWISGKNSSGLPPEKFRRCWPFHVLLKPFLHWMPQIWTERMFYALFPTWRIWLRRQKLPACDVVHAIMGYATEPFESARRSGALKVIDCQNSHPTSYYGYWQRECDLWCPGERVPIPHWMFARMARELEIADLVLCPSNFVRDTMVTNGLPADKCFINPFGVDTGVFQKRLTVPARPRFISVGTICLRKGHQYLFRAWERVRSVLPEAELICVGDFKRDFRRERAHWAGRFRHIEYLSHRELAELLPTCTAFVLASVEEGFARVLSEAMAAGLPVVATYESGVSTLVTDGVEGLVVPARRVEVLADGLLKVAQDRALNERMGAAAYQRGAARNSWLDYGERLLAEYERRLKLRKQRASLMRHSK